MNIGKLYYFAYISLGTLAITHALSKRDEREKVRLNCDGGPCRNRTCDTLIKSQMLYRLS